MDVEQGSAGAALAVLSGALDGLVAAVDAGGLDHLGTADLVLFLQRFEQVRNRMSLVDHRALGDAERRDLAGSLCQGRLSRVLQHALQISAGEAGRRVRAAEQLGARTSMLGEPLPPARPLLAEAQREGQVTPEQVSIILSCLGRVDRDGIAQGELAHGEAMLTELARSFGPKDLQRCADRFVECLEPDGNLPQDELIADRRDVRLKVCRDGSWRAEMRLTGALGSKLQALLSPLARPRPAVLGPDGSVIQAADERTQGQRMHDALEDLCDRLLRAGDEPGSGGVPATVVVTIDYDDLLARTGHGRTSDGTRIPAAELLEMAAEAEIIPVVLNRSGAVLSLGRSRRIASRAQTLALVARDGGCSFPGCSHPPEWCERHHIREWIDGGPTDLDNLTLLCRYHHHNFASRGWTCRLDGGTPTWVPPRFVDPQQRPLVNNRIRAARHQFELMA